MKEKPKKKISYKHSEVLKSIEDGINIWDFSTKFGIPFLEKGKVLEVLIKCTDDKNRAQELFEVLSNNSTKYAKENVDPKAVLNYNTLLHLAKKGLSRNEIMKVFGRTSYQAFTSALTSSCRKDNINSDYQNNLRAIINQNSKLPEITFVADATKEKITDIPQEVIEETADVIQNNKDNKDDKLVLYTIEYLKKQASCLEDLFDNDDEHVLLSCTIERFMRHSEIKESSKIFLNEALNSQKATCLVVNTEYKAENNNCLSIENDIVLSQAIMLSNYTNKKIFIATVRPQTALNALTLGFGVRVPKSFVHAKFADIVADNIQDVEYYFDYELSGNLYESKSATILDTCIIINNAKNTMREKILSDTTQEKVLTRIVLDELVEPITFFSTLFTAKCNPSITLDLNTVLKYNFNDIAILNYAMLYKLNTGKDVTVITHDMQFYLEALKYNMKVKYFPSTYMDTFKVEPEEVKIQDETYETENMPEVSICEEKAREIISPIETPPIVKVEPKITVEKGSNNTDKPVYHEHVAIQMVSSKPVIFKQSKVICVKSGDTLNIIQPKGKKGQQYYPIEIGDFVSLKNDPNLYRITALTGRKNLESVDLT